MATQPSDLIIKDFNLGIGPSPHYGFGDMRNLDITTIPGVARLNNPLALSTGTASTALPQWLVRDPITPTQLFSYDAGGTVTRSVNSGATWATATGGTATAALGQGAIIWKDYLFIARSAALDVYGPLSGTPVWTIGWKAIDSDTKYHPMIVSYNDGNIYGGAGQYIFSIAENTAPFAPATAGSYVFTARALDLPANYRVKCLAELGNDLEIGTWMGTNVYDFKVSDLFSWNRSDPSFGTPVQMHENGVNAMINIGNALYMQVGIEGKIFKSNGVSATPIAQVPSSVCNLEGGLYLEPFPGAIMNFKGRLFFGVSSGGSSAPGGCGVWSLQETSKGTILNFEHDISTGNSGATNPLKIGAMLGTTRDIALVGWQDNTSYGIDKTSITARSTGYTGYVDSPFYRVGTPLVKRQFGQGEFQLVNKLAANEGVRLAYRTGLNEAFTTIGTYDYATLGAVYSHNFTTNVPDCEFVQIRVYLTGTTTTPQLRYVMLR
jgi:hypothetical protein